MSTVPQKSRILIVTTGGTITMFAGEDGTLVPSGDSPGVLKRVPELGSIAELDFVTVGDDDSSNLQPAFWLDVAQAIYDVYESYDGFVVTHGTDTMVYTAAALSFVLQELGKPIVLTGAQVPLVNVGSDGRSNLVNAVRVATSDLAEVCVVFGTRVIRGTRVRKVSAFDLQAFQTINALALGTIGLTLRLEDHARRRASRRRPLFTSGLCPEVARIPTWPGMDPEILRFLGAHHRGLVIEGFGVGTLPSTTRSLVPAIRDITNAGVPVVVCTQCVVGSTAMELYSVGRGALDAGAIPAMDMTPEAAQVKLMWALGQSRDLRVIESMMLKDYAGEITASS
jgi:L-asparaginase